MENEIVGTIVPDPIDDRLLIYNVDQDTLPQNTMNPVDGVINPLVVGPNAGLPGPVNGRRYLIVEDIGHEGDPTVAWGDLVAKANDIIQFESSTMSWFVAFAANEAADGDVEYVTNLANNVQYRYVQQEGQWMKSYEGWYDQGDYSIVI
jgi:hypothetical protein